MTTENRSNRGKSVKWEYMRCKFGNYRSVTGRDNAHISSFYDDLKTDKVGQVDLVFAYQ